MGTNGGIAGAATQLPSPAAGEMFPGSIEELKWEVIDALTRASKEVRTLKRALNERADGKSTAAAQAVALALTDLGRFRDTLVGFSAGDKSADRIAESLQSLSRKVEQIVPQLEAINHGVSSLGEVTLAISGSLSVQPVQALPAGETKRPRVAAPVEIEAAVIESLVGVFASVRGEVQALRALIISAIAVCFATPLVGLNVDASEPPSLWSVAQVGVPLALWLWGAYSVARSAAALWFGGSQPGFLRRLLPLIDKKVKVEFDEEEYSVDLKALREVEMILIHDVLTGFQDLLDTRDRSGLTLIRRSVKEQVAILKRLGGEMRPAVRGVFLFGLCIFSQYLLAMLKQVFALF